MDSSASSQASGRHLHQQNVLKVRPGPTANSSLKIVPQSPLPVFRVFSNEAMSKNLQKRTSGEVQQVSGNTTRIQSQRAENIYKSYYCSWSCWQQKFVAQMYVEQHLGCSPNYVTSPPNHVTPQIDAIVQ